MADLLKNEISVAVRIRPLTEKETALLQQVDYSTPFTGDGSLAAAPSSSSSAANATSAYLSGRSPNSFVRKVVKALDDRVLVFDPPETNPMTSYQKQLLGPSVKKVKDMRYCFDRVFDETAGQQDVFEGCAQHLVPGVLDGYNGTVFAYGATGCGKTHTISGSTTQPGIVFLLMKDLFDRIAARKDEITVDVTISYLEIYNETIRDLLVPNSPATLGLRESDGRVVVPGLSEQVPSSAEEVVSMIISANANRTVSATEANAVSSRSHAVLCVNVKQKARTADLTEDYTMATLSVIDLAGSERASATKNKGDRLIEGANINRSLLALGNCINALCDVKKSGGHVPYRDSKLTRLLKHSLGGNCRTVMIVCVSPSSHHYDESFNTLQYANRAKEIKTKVTRNVVSVDRHVSQYVRVIYELRQEVESLKKNGGDREKVWRENQRSARDETVRDVEDAIAKIRKAYEESKDRISRIGSARAELHLVQTMQQALEQWKSAVFPTERPANPSYSWPVDNLLSSYTTKARNLASDIAAAENAKSMYEAISATLSRKFTNPLGNVATQYPELVRYLNLQIKYIQLEIQHSSSQSEQSMRMRSGEMWADLEHAISDCRDKIVADVSIAGENAHETLKNLLESVDEASGQISRSLLAAGTMATGSRTPLHSLSLPLQPITSSTASKKRSTSARSPLPDAPFSISTNSSARPGKSQRPSLAANTAAGSRPSPTGTQKPSSAFRSMTSTISTSSKAPTMPRPSLKPTALSRKSSSSNLNGSKTVALEEKKGVVWKDDAGEKLTEEHSKSIIEYSDTSGDISATTLVGDGATSAPAVSGPSRATRVLPPASSARRKLGSVAAVPSSSSTSTILEEDEMSSISADLSASNSVADLENTSLASSTADSSFGSDGAASNVPRPQPTKAAGRSNLGAKARSSLAPRRVSSPRKARSPVARRVSQIGPIRSLKTSRRASYIDPADMSTSAANNTTLTGLASPHTRRASRTTVSFQNKVAANAAAIAARRQSASIAGGITARIAAQRAKREKETLFAFSGNAGPSTTNMTAAVSSAGPRSSAVTDARPSDTSMDHGSNSSMTKGLPTWR